MLLKILNEMIVVHCWRERERERERDLYIYEQKCPTYLVLYHLHLQHLHTGNLKEHTCARNNIDHMLDISGHLQL